MKRTDENTINSLHRDLRRRMFEAGLQIQMIEDGRREQVKVFLEGLNELTGYSALVTMEEEKNFFPGIISVAPFMIPLLEQEHEKVKEVAEMGFTKVVSKPFQLQEFMNEVDGMLGI